MAPGQNHRRAALDNEWLALAGEMGIGRKGGDSINVYLKGKK